MTIDGAESMEDAMRKIYRARAAPKPTSELVRLLVGYWMDADESWGARSAASKRKRSRACSTNACRPETS